MTDDDRAQLQRAERLLHELKSAGDKRDARIELINNRVNAVCGLPFGFASLTVILGAAYAIKQADGDVVKIVVCVIFGLGLFLTIRSASKGGLGTSVPLPKAFVFFPHPQRGIFCRSCK